MKGLTGILLASALLPLLAACGGAGGSYTLGGTVSGLRGRLALANDGDRVTITENGPFAFPNKLPNGARYRVTIETPPLFERCTVANGEGTVRGADVRDVAVTCEDKAWQGPQGLEPDLAGDAHRVQAALAGNTPLVAWEERHKIYLTTGGEGGWSDPEPVAQNDADSLGLAGNPSGFAAMAWTELDGGVHRVFARVYSGGRWSGDRALSQAGRESLYAALAVNDVEGAAAAWSDHKGNPRIAVSRYRQGAWTAPVYLSAAGTVALMPAAAVNNRGEVLVAWVQQSKVYASVYENGRWGAPEQLPGNLQTNLDVHVFLDDAGRGYAVWRAIDANRQRLTLAVRAGGAWSAMPLGVNAPGEPVLAGSRRRGTVAVVWTDWLGPPTRAVWVRLYENGRWGDPILLSLPDTEAEGPAAAMDERGNTLVAWQQPGAGGHPPQIFAAFRQYGEWAKPAGPNDLLSFAGRVVRPASSEGSPGVALARGRALVAWSQDDGQRTDRASANLYR